MTYTPPNYTPQPALSAGVHTCVLSAFKPAPPAKNNGYAAAFNAVYQDVDTGSEVQDFIAFGRPGNPKGDYWSGVRIERLFAIMGLPAPEPGKDLDITALLLAAEGTQFLVELKQNGQYLNIDDVRALEGAAVAGDDQIAF